MKPRHRRVGRRFSPALELLEQRQVLAAAPVISEFMASNSGSLVDEDGDNSDWIEIENRGDEPIDLAGWHLTDEADNLDKWEFPSVTVSPGAFLIVFASNKDRAVSGSQLHTDFELAAGGEYLALVAPDETTIVHEFAPEFPPQATDVSYGSVPQPVFTDIVASGAAARVQIPVDDSLGFAWTEPGFADAAWTAAATGVGYDTAGDYDALFGANGDVEAAMRGVNSTAYLRVPFAVADPAGVDVLRLQMQYDDGFIAYLNGSEIARRNAPSSVPSTNLTIAGTSTGSSEGWGTVFKDGNDGNRDGNYGNGSVYHTTGTPEANPPSFWEVDLGADFYLDRVQIFPRTSADQSSVQNFRLTVVDSENTQVFLRDYFAADSTRDKPWGTNDLRNVFGQKIRIQRIAQNEPNFMTFAEVEVWGRPGPLGINLAKGQPVTSSPASGTLLAARGNDGNLDGHAAHAGTPVYQSAASGVGQFWQVDLGAELPLQYVNLFARADVALTNNVQLSVLNASLTPVYTTTINLGGTEFGGQRFDVVQTLPNNLSGRYVKLSTLANEPLSFAEIEIFGPTTATLPLDLADMVGGGDGTGSGLPQGISVVTGDPVASSRADTAGGPVNAYHVVGASPFIDGVFVPDGGTGGATPVPVTSTGLVATGISDTNGVSWDEIWNGDNTGVSGGPATASRIGMHANKGITFDLDAIEAANPGMSAVSFRTTAATANCAAASVDMYVLLDGAIFDYVGLDGANQSSRRSVPIAAGQRFLTLVASSRGPDNCDWSLFGDPTLDLADGAATGGGSTSAYNAAALADRPDSQAVVPQTIDITPYRNLLTPGTNVLAIHGLNVSASDSDFLIVPRLQAASLDSVGAFIDGFLLTPSPGSFNAGESAGLGPAITDVAHAPLQPTAGQAVTVTATVSPKRDTVQGVQLHSRAMFGAEVAVTMFDDGLHGDGAPGDGQFGATIPSGGATAGQMLRYYVTSIDTAGRDARAPAFLDRTGTKQSPEYFGMVVANPGLTTTLPVLNWFAQNSAAGHTRSGTRGVVSYGDEFYDNVFFRERGAFTVGGSQKFVFNKGYGFKFREDIGRVEEFNLNTRGSDPSYMRQVLAYETYQKAGVPSPDSFLTYVQLNGAFDRVGIFIEQVDEDLLDRFGLDPDGALYKLTSSPNPSYGPGTVAEKKTRQNESDADYQAVVTGLSQAITTPAQIAAMRAFVFDTFDVPAMLSYLAARTIVQDLDDTRKNHYLYRDTNGSRLWQMLPWDKDWTFGEVGLGGTVVADRDDEVATGNANINFASHPFIGDSTHMLYQVQWSRLLDVFYKLPETREMYLRRLRSLMDELLQPPGTPLAERKFENRVDAIFAPADPHLDASVTTAVNNLKSQYFEPRRIHLYQTLGIDNTGGGAPATTLIPAASPNARYFIPTTTTPTAATWTAPSFVDSAWTQFQFGIGFERTPSDPVNYVGLLNTDINTGMSGRTSVYTRQRFNVADRTAVRDLMLRIKYDDGFVAYLNGTEVARRNITGTPAFNSVATTHDDTAAINYETITLAKTALVNGLNVLAIHGINAGAASTDLLFDFELIEGQAATTDVGVPHAQAGNPTINFGAIEFSPASANQDEEYIELVNPSATSVDVSGWKLTGGVTHTFDLGTVILPGRSLYVTPKETVFRARATGPRGGQGLFIQGNYNGHISSFGERIELVAADDTVVSSVDTPSVPTDLQRYLRVAEIMYHPANPTPEEAAAGHVDGDLFEFIELVNISPTVTLDLSGVAFTGGIGYTFGAASLAPGERVVLVSNVAAFAARYGASIEVTGQYTGNLSNGGEEIRLDDAEGGSIHDFTYDDNGPTWHPSTDGAGYSLVIVDLGVPLDDWSLGERWRPSLAVGGSPGSDDALLGDFDGDGRVGLLDLAILQVHLGTPSGATALEGDMNGDGAINRADAALFVRQFGRSPSPPSLSRTPLIAAPAALVRRSVATPPRPAVAARQALSARWVDLVLDATNVLRTVARGHARARSESR